MGVTLVTLLLHFTLLLGVLVPIGDEMAVRLASELRTVEAALRTADPSERASLAEALNGPGLRLDIDPARLDGAEHEAVQDPLLEQLQASSGRPLQHVASTDAAGKSLLSIAVPIDDQVWWVTFIARRPQMQWTLLPLLVGMVVIGMAVGVTLVAGVTLITRPMSALSAQLLQRRDGLRQIDEPEQVSVELQRIIRAFNSLVQSVEQSARSHRELLAGLSHDLRAPLARLRLRVETECSATVAARMENDFSAVLRITEQFLAYVHGQGDVSGEALSPLGELVEDVVARYQEAGACVELPLCSSCSVLVPDLSVRRALGNLLDNALVHGRPPVQVELVMLGAEMRLAVFDHGRGIAPADLNSALQPFVRLGGAAGARPGHCGLGLTIVQQVAQQLGGRTLLIPFDGMRSGLAILLPVQGPSTPRAASACELADGVDTPQVCGTNM